ncbi:MAG: LytTR family DNA-binding domain-containing protein [Flavobacteriaceae bacterium]|jgi:DNA-binding LytR/AlgR family response regulator|uniref:Response regulator transcription factor n=1 Tax=Flavobacterium kayseriense TaxID=2764714 RepID=A0ABR7J4C8_9FLAO|nr:LytTR family DNA-binding domain-containing protein [Flavobacterium kayseriense]MBC5840312.1 response regulator transcription factor [Flavobacterium kayseriense]MBC5847018.1 response regulator transcription factor [Flavobacterium kayseriense]MBX9888126.1 LytTR family DNA-binding domain-containing protein [Flavobacteriaceae bacterium]
MNHLYIIIDDNQESVLKTKAIADSFSELQFLASANNYDEGLNLILEHSPQLIFLEIDPSDKKSNLSLRLISELHRYLKVIPKIIVTTSKKDLAFEALQYDVAGYILKPLARIDFVKLILKIKKEFEQKVIQPAQEGVFINSEDIKLSSAIRNGGISNEEPLILCVKSYGDYRYIDTRDICYLQADNNSTDIHLNNGEMVTAFKTLKHFEGALTFPFVRIHNSYIVNTSYISRIHTGNSVCYIKNTAVKLPFSKSYKGNIDLIISEISSGNYLEI